MLRQPTTRPARLPVVIATERIADVPIHRVDEEDWSLCAVRLEPATDASVRLE